MAKDDRGMDMAAGMAGAAAAVCRNASALVGRSARSGGEMEVVLRTALGYSSGLLDNLTAVLAEVAGGDEEGARRVLRQALANSGHDLTRLGERMGKIAPAEGT